MTLILLRWLEEATSVRVLVCDVGVWLAPPTGICTSPWTWSPITLWTLARLTGRGGSFVCLDGALIRTDRIAGDCLAGGVGGVFMVSGPLLLACGRRG